MTRTHQLERAETTVQSVVLVPVVFLLAFMCFHIGSLFHQAHIAQLAAVRGVTVASALEQSSQSVQQAQKEVERVAQDLGSQLVSTPEVNYRQQGVEVRVRIKASSAISFLPSIASAEVWRPLEQFRLEQNR